MLHNSSLTIKTSIANQSGAMEADTILKNGQSLKIYTNIKNSPLVIIVLVSIMFSILSCSNGKISDGIYIYDDPNGVASFTFSGEKVVTDRTFNSTYVEDGEYTYVIKNGFIILSNEKRIYDVKYKIDGDKLIIYDTYKNANSAGKVFIKVVQDDGSENLNHTVLTKTIDENKANATTNDDNKGNCNENVTPTTEDKSNSNENKMTMTTTKKSVEIGLAGRGTFTIDWGDGKVVKGTLLVWNRTDDGENEDNIYKHNYIGTSSTYSITITGNITNLVCYGNGVTSLDVSKNTTLTSLYCGGNPLTSLDVSKNIALTELNCQWNPFTSLNVSKNIALKSLDCDDNKLTKLDVSKNTALTYLSCRLNQLTNLDVSKNNTALTYLNCGGNQLTSSALNALFEMLPSKTGDISISTGGNPGTDTCDRSIATNKGWIVD